MEIVPVVAALSFSSLKYCLPAQLFSLYKYNSCSSLGKYLVFNHMTETFAFSLFE